jgi:CDP-diacylglycerol--glycerol-3-phosphate 3-phosphatidyltransferase
LGASGSQGRVTVTLANILTLIRLAIVPLFWLGFFSPVWGIRVAATALFAFGALTDLWDGILARGRNEVTRFGDFMDPLADKLLVLSGFWAILIREDWGPAFYYQVLAMIVLITLRETVLTLMRVRALGGGSAVITSVWGKMKTGVQLVTLLSALACLNMRDLLPGAGAGTTVLHSATFRIILCALIFLSMLTSLVSGGLYLRAARLNRSRT